MTEAPLEVVTIVVNGRNVVLDPANMRFSEANLSEYMTKEYGWLCYFGHQLELAQKELSLAEIDAETEQSMKFMESKDAGNTDTYAKSFSIAHADVVIARKKVADCKETVGLLKAHLKAWDKSHDNVQNRGHTLRKELDRLNRDIRAEPEGTFVAEDIFK